MVCCFKAVDNRAMKVDTRHDLHIYKLRSEQESDVFILSGAEDLVPRLVETEDGWKYDSFRRTVNGVEYQIDRYRPRVEGLFARIERWTRSDGDVHWRSLSKENILTLYGKDDNSRIVIPGDQHVFSWLISETRDSKGNVILYSYKAEDGTGLDLTQAHERNRGGRDDPRRAANRYLKSIRYGNACPYWTIRENGRFF